VVSVFLVNNYELTDCIAKVHLLGRLEPAFITYLDRLPGGGGGKIRTKEHNKGFELILFTLED